MSFDVVCWLFSQPWDEEDIDDALFNAFLQPLAKSSLVLVVVFEGQPPFSFAPTATKSNGSAMAPTIRWQGSQKKMLTD